MMGKPFTDTKVNAPLTPDQWPDWVLAFNGGYFELDKVKQDEQHKKFREWKESSRQWFADHGLKDSQIERHAELRRRAAAWQLLHPEDRGANYSLIERKVKNESTD